MKEFFRFRFYLLFIVFSFLMVPKTVFAAPTFQEMSPDGFSIEATSDSTADNKFKLNLRFSGAESNYKYYVLFVKANNSKVDFNKYVDKNTGAIKYSTEIGEMNIVSNSGLVLIDNAWFIADGYEYAYIIRNRANSTTYEYTKGCIAVPKPALSSLLNERYTIELFPEFNKIRISPAFPYTGELGSSNYGKHTVAVKIALITDKNIISKFQNDATDKYETLLNYAKSSNVKVYNLTDSGAEINAADIDIVENGVYFIYTTYNDPDHYYRVIDGINVIMGTEEFFTLSVDWENAVTAKKADNTLLYIILISLVVVVIVAVVLVKIKDKKEERAEKKKKEAFMNNFINSVNNPNRQGFSGTVSQQPTTQPPQQTPSMPQQPAPPSYMPNNNGYNNYNNGMNGYPNNYNNQNNNRF